MRTVLTIAKLVLRFPKDKMSGVCFQLVLTVALVLATCHCTTLIPLCLTGDFEAQTIQLLHNQLMTREELVNLTAVFDDLENTLQLEWPGSEVCPLGSVITGLAMKWSDTDCMIKVPNYSTYNTTASRYLIQKALKLLRKQPNLYQDVRAKYRRNKADLMKLTYVPTQRTCDINFIDQSALVNTRMVGYYYTLDNRALTVASILKIWKELHSSHSINWVSSYTLNLCVIFYFQQEKILPSYYVLKRSSDSKHYVDELYNTRNSKSVHELLGGFFKYYSEFNFDEYVISPLFGRAVRKEEFKDFGDLPEEFTVYEIYVKDRNETTIEFSKPICVQDPIEPHTNTANRIKYDDAREILNHVKIAARAFQNLPEHKFLKAILEYKQGHEIDVDEAIKECIKIKRLI